MSVKMVRKLQYLWSLGSKLLFSNLAEILCFVHVVTLPAYHFMSSVTTLGIDAYLLWLLALIQPCYSLWECFSYLQLSLLLFSVYLD